LCKTINDGRQAFHTKEWQYVSNVPNVKFNPTIGFQFIFITINLVFGKNYTINKRNILKNN
jgi:hypothetical protein